MKILPFNFERLGNDSYFLSNLGGFHAFLDRENLESLISFGSTDGESLNRYLEARQFICSDHTEESTALALASAVSKKLTAELTLNPIFMIVPTLRCDHSCTYCQVSRASEKATGYDLEVESIEKIISIIKRIGRPPYKLEIQGGEPLLRFDLVQHIYQSASEQLGNENFEFVIATSLSLLTPEVLSWANRESIYFSASLDGSEIIHNKNRILPTGNSSKRLASAIDSIHAAYGPNKVNTVTTATKDLLSNPEDIIQAHERLGLKDMFIRPISQYGFAKTGNKSNYSTTEFIAFYSKLFDLLLERWKSGNKLIEHYGAIHLKRVFSPNFSNYADLKSPSGVLLNSIVFNYDGKVFGSDELRMIQRLTPEADFSLGSINDLDPKSSDLYKTILKNSFNAVTPGCSSCAFQPFCGSDPSSEISNQGDPIGDKSLSSFCSNHKSMFQFLLTRWSNCELSRAMMSEWINE